MKGIQNIDGFVHDQDSKTSNFIRNNLNISEYIDPNHANKSFAARFASYNSGKIKNIRKGSLNGAQSFIYSVRHEKCLHAPYQSRTEEMKNLPKWAIFATEEKLNALRIFLNDSIQYVEKINPKYNTQINEAFHNLKALLAPKSFAWGGSYLIRMTIAVLRFNEPDLYFNLLTKAIGIGTHFASTMSALATFIKIRNLKKKKGKKQKEHQKN